MKKNKNVLPYTITVIGTLETESDEFEKMEQELLETNKEYLISHADAIFIEADKDEFERIRKNDSNVKNRISEKLEDINRMVIKITKDEVLNLDIKRIDKVLSQLRKDVNNSQSKLSVIFDGWEDSKNIYQIEEIRRYVSKVFKENKDLFYFLTEENYNSNKILACISTIENIKEDNSKLIYDHGISKKITEEIMKSIIIATDFDEKRAKEKIDKLFISGWED